MSFSTSKKIASLHSRIYALLIDAFFALFVMQFMFLNYEQFSGESGSGYTVGIIISPQHTILYVLSWLLHISLTEGWTGRSPGKRIMKIKVVSSDGNKMNVFRSLLRHVFDPLDILVLPILFWTDGTRRRVGDRVAKTLVVEARS